MAFTTLYREFQCANIALSEDKFIGLDELKVEYGIAPATATQGDIEARGTAALALGQPVSLDLESGTEAQNLQVFDWFLNTYTGGGPLGAYGGQFDMFLSLAVYDDFVANGPTATSYVAWQDNNDTVFANYSSRINIWTPNLYAYYGGDQDWWAGWATAWIDECQRLDNTKSVIPYIGLHHFSQFGTGGVGPAKSNGDPLDAGFMDRMLDVCDAAGCTAVILWDSATSTYWSVYSAQPWWSELQAWALSVLSLTVDLTASMGNWDNPSINLLVNPDWLERTLNVPDGWNNFSGGWDDFTTHDDTPGDYSIATQVTVAQRAYMRLIVSGLTISGEYTFYMYISAHSSGQDIARFESLAGGPDGAAFAGAGWYALGVVPTLTGHALRVGAGVDANATGTDTFSRVCLREDFVEGITANDQLVGPLDHEPGVYSPAKATLTLSGKTPVLSVEVGNSVYTPAKASLTLSGGAPTLDVSVPSSGLALPGGSSFLLIGM